MQVFFPPLFIECQLPTIRLALFLSMEFFLTSLPFFKIRSPVRLLPSNCVAPPKRGPFLMPNNFGFRSQAVRISPHSPRDPAFVFRGPADFRVSPYLPTVSPFLESFDEKSPPPKGSPSGHFPRVGVWTGIASLLFFPLGLSFASEFLAHRPSLQAFLRLMLCKTFSLWQGPSALPKGFVPVIAAAFQE